MKPGYLLMTIVLISIPLPSQLFILDLYDTHIQRSKSAGKLSSPQSVIKGLKRKKKNSPQALILEPQQEAQWQSRSVGLC